MGSIQKFFRQIPLPVLGVLTIILFLTAFIPNLGQVAFIGDEAIRALVAFEMDQSGNFIVPTLNGEPYFNKPPLYNWCIYLTSSFFGYYGEWPSRLTTVILLGAFAWVVFHFIRRNRDVQTGLVMALMLLTSGRILFWDSMLGLIDIAFSAVIFLNWMLLWSLGNKENWKSFFLYSYLLFAVAFMLKGLPAMVFQGLSVLTALYLHDALRKKFFSFHHLMGICAGGLVLLAYYIPYARQVSLEHVLGILFDQSMQRTATHHGIWASVKHLFTFPPEQIYHFLPWSLFVVIVFHPRFRKWLKADAFIRFNFWMLVINLPVYWASVQVFPRYLLMFIPLFNLTGYFILEQSKLESSGRWWNTFRWVFVCLSGAILLAVWGMPLFPGAARIENMILIWISASLCLAFFFLGVWLDTARTFIWVGLFLLVARSAFNLAVLPVRSAEFRENITRESCRRVATQHGDRTWYLYRESFPHEVARFYTSAFSGQQIRRSEAATDTTAFYLVDRTLYPDFKGVVSDSIILERGQILHLMQPSGSEKN